jgi:hypothetical protein
MARSPEKQCSTPPISAARYFIVGIAIMDNQRFASVPGELDVSTKRVSLKIPR